MPGQLDVNDALSIAKETEELGFASLWSGENPFTRNAFAMTAAFAISTSKIRIGTSIVNMYTRNPILLASSAITLDQLSNGRFILGLGTSHGPTIESIGGQIEKPIERMRETIQVVRRSLSGERFSHQGEFYRIRNAQMTFRPIQKQLPIFVAALGKKMIRLAGEMADGVLLIHNTVSYAKYAVEEIRAAAREAGRDPSHIQIACWLTTCVSSDSKAALNSVKKSVGAYGRLPFYQHHYKACGFERETALIANAYREGKPDEAVGYVSDDMAREMTLSGTAEECHAKLEDYTKAGIQYPILSPHPTGDDIKRATLDAIRSLAG